MGVKHQVPIYINVRDRLTDLQKLVSWLERAGHERITLIDNASTYGPLQDYLHSTKHRVYFLDENLGPQALWKADLVPDERFVWTDPDVLPVEECPLDLVDHLLYLHEIFPMMKVGPGIRTDDVPNLDPDSKRVEGIWQERWREIYPGLYKALIDTTFALYPRKAQFEYFANRTWEPYVIRHLPWYRSMSELTEEDRYYLERAIPGEKGSRWAEKWQSYIH